MDDVRRDGHTNAPRRAVFTRAPPYVYTHIRACTRGHRRHTRARIARATAAERGQRVASPVNNAGRGNGAISAHLLLNVRFAVLPPRVPPRAYPALAPCFPLPTSRPTLRVPPTYISHPEPAPRHGRVTATLTALFLADSG